MDAKYHGQIVARLNSEGVTNLSDESLASVLGPCVGGKKLIDTAKRLREDGSLTDADLILEDTDKEDAKHVPKQEHDQE